MYQSHWRKKIRAYCDGIEKNGDYVKNPQESAFYQFPAKVAHVPLRYGTYQYVKRSRRVTRCIPQPINAITPLPIDRLL